MSAKVDALAPSEGVVVSRFVRGSVVPFQFSLL
jgi:hypothetical protein